MEGIGNMLTEEFTYDSASGEMTAHSTWEYKPPMAADVPVDSRVSLLGNTPSAWGFMRSKASGEPPRTLAVAVLLAVQHAVGEARGEAQLKRYNDLSAPATIDKVQSACGVDMTQFVVTE